MIIDTCQVQDSIRYKARGLFATQDIPKGTIVMLEETCPKCHNVTEEDLQRNLGKEASDYLLEHLPVTRLSHPKVLLLCDSRIGFINHSCDSNVMELYPFHNDIAVRDIKAGEEITYDYRMLDDNGVNYPECLCGEPNCCGHVFTEWPATRELLEFWDGKLRPAFFRSILINQPLAPYLPRAWWKKVGQHYGIGLKRGLPCETDGLHPVHMGWGGPVLEWVGTISSRFFH